MLLLARVLAVLVPLLVTAVDGDINTKVELPAQP
jgi:hypothetical protein